MAKPQFPVSVKRGHVVVKIHLTPSDGSDQFTVAYHFNGNWVRRAFGDYHRALTEAETVATKLCEGDLNVLPLKNEARLADVRAAVEFFLKKHPGSMPRKPVPVVADELLATSEGDGMSAVYLKDLRCRLGRFAEEFKGPISAVTPTEIEYFLRLLKLTGRSRNNDGRAIGAFAGLRHAEIQRSDWSEVRLDNGFIEIKAGKAKTASRWLVPVLDNLKRWLQPLWKPTGPVCGFANMSKQILRVTAIQNVAQVASEAGNSPRMVFTNYRDLVRPAAAREWFGIAPEK